MRGVAVSDRLSASWPQLGGAVIESQPQEAASRCITIRDLCHSFGERRVLEDINLDICQEEFVAVVGPSGCGKTTLLNVLGALEPHQQGDVSILGRTPARGDRNVAMMFASDVLLPWKTAWENALFGVRVRGELTPQIEKRATDMLREIGLDSFRSAYPRQMSRGMRQRVALVRTFLMDSELLLMDEPFAALDAQTRIILQRQLLSLWESSRRTVVLITHDLSEAILLADRVIVFGARPGRVLADVNVGIPRPRDTMEVRTQPTFQELYSQLWQLLESELLL